MTWAFILLALIGSFLIIRKNYFGFLLWIVADSWFFATSLRAQHYDQAAIFLLYILMACYGLTTWSEEIDD